MHKLLRSISRHLLVALLCSTAAAQPPKPPATAAAATATNPTPAPQNTSAPPTQPPLTGVVGDRNNTLLDRIPPEQMVSLQADNDNFPARYIADLSGLPRGAVIILHASGQHPSWPFTVAALIDDLPLHGWSTLAIELPAPPQDASAVVKPAPNPASPPPATNAPATPAAAPTNNPAAANNSTTANNPTAAPTGIEAQAQARINAAIKFFVDQKQTNVVLLGFGSGATRAAKSVQLAVANQATPNTAPITALVLITPANRLIGLDQDLPKILPATGLPTLDIILNSDPQALADAEARRRAVLHQRERIYRRLELPPIAEAESAQHLLMVRRVRAWLQRQSSDVPKE